MYRLLEDYTLEVSWEGQESPAADLAIPASAKVGGIAYNVAAVAPGAFARFESLAKVTLPSSVERVGDGAFEGCSALEGVLLPEGLESIGADAFAGTALAHITLPSTLRDLAGGRAFADCAELQRVLTLSNDVQVAADTLAGCQGAVVWTPWSQGERSPWDEAVADGRNNVVRYGLSLSAEPMRLEVGQEADLFDGGVREVPDGCELAYSYAAMPISVEAGIVTGKKPGTSEVAAALSLEGRELARATRTVEVVPASEEPTAPEGDGSEEGSENGQPEGEGPAGDAPEAEEPVPGEPEGEEPAPDEEASEAPAEGEGEEEGSGEEAEEPVIPDSAILRSTVELSAEPLAAAEVAPYATGDTFVSGNYLYTMLADGTVSIGHANTSVPTASVTLPSSVSYGGKSYTVSAITARGFAGNTALTKVTLPKSIKAIGEEAFKGATLLNACNMSAATSITTIPNGCFMDCPKLVWSNTKFPSTLTSLGSSSFRNCTSLRQVTLPASVTQVGSYAYAGCTVLGKDVSDTETRYMRFPSVKRIEEGTFQGCTGMQWDRVKLATNLEYIGPRAFENCKGLGRVKDLPDTLSYIGPYAFSNCTGMKSAVLPAGITNIEEGVFQGCTSLSWNGTADNTTGFQAKGALASIGKNAFKGCTSINGAFDVTRGGKVGVVGSGVPFSIGDAAFEGTGITSIENIRMEYGDRIGAFAFKSCTALKTANLGRLQVLNDETFKGCINLASVDASYIQTIGNYVFEGCSKLTSIGISHLSHNMITGESTIASDLKTIGVGAFKNSGLTTFDFLSSLTTIGAYAFNNCTALSAFSTSEAQSLTSIGVGAFKNSGITYAGIPGGVTIINNETFRDCPNLTSIYGMDNVTSIGNDAFRGCTTLKSIPFGSKLDTIGGWAFEGCSSLAISEMPESLKGLGGSAFRNCSAITSMVLYPGLTFVGDSSFKNCPITKAVCLGSSYNTDGVDIFSGLDMRLHCLKSTADFWKSHTLKTTVTSGEGMAFSTNKLALTYKGGTGTVKVTKAPYAADDFTGFYTTWGSPNNSIATQTSGSGSWGDRTYSPKGIGTTTVKVSLDYRWANGTKSVNFGEIAQFDIQVSAYTYKIVYKANGGNGTDYTQNFTYGQAQNIKHFYNDCKFTRQGCTSTWWSTAPNGSGGTNYSPGQSVNLDPGPNATVTLYAQWRWNQYRVAFNGNGATGGTAVATKGLNYNDNYTIPACTWNRTGYTFTGWNTQANGSGTSYSVGQVASKMASGDGDTVTLHAQWKVITYDMKFSKYNATSGDEVTGDYPTGQVLIPYTGTFTAPKNKFVKTGYTFVGWNTKRDGTGTTFKEGAAVSMANLVKETPGVVNSATGYTDITFYPVWQPVKFTVYFDGWYANDPNYDNTLRRIIWENISYGQEVTMPANPFINIGHKFTGWTVGEPTSEKQRYQPNEKININVTPSGGQVWFEASWEAISYKVAFDSNGGTGSVPGQISAKYNADIAMPAAGNLSKAGYTFGGWNTQADGKGTNYNAGQAVKNLTASDNDTVKLYAKWVPKPYKVIFVKGVASASGTSPAVVNTNYDATLTMPANPFSLTGYRFTGWNPRAELDGTDWAAGASVKIADILKEQPEADTRGGDIYLHANLVPITYQIVFNQNYGWLQNGKQHPAEITATYNADVSMPENPYVRTGYTFGGWFDPRSAEQGGTGKVLQAGQVASKPNLASQQGYKLMLLAKWDANPYKIHFDANKPEGATLKGGMADLDMAYDAAKNLTKNAFTCEADGKRIAFMGWNTKADGSGDAFADQAEAKNLASDKDAVVTLYAQWKEVVVIDVTAPIKPLIGVEMFTGDIRTAASSFSSRSVADVRMTKAVCEAGADIASVFPEGSENIELTMTDGDGNDLALKLGQTKELAAASTTQFKIAKGSSTSPSKLDVEFGLNLPDGTTWQLQDGPQDFASVTYTFEVA